MSFSKAMVRVLFEWLLLFVFMSWGSLETSPNITGQPDKSTNRMQIESDLSNHSLSYYFRSLRGKSLSEIYENFKRMFLKGVIMPGTNYCGRGSRAKFEGDLGYLRYLDECCMEHDNCTDILHAGEAKDRLKNEVDVTILNCGCDDEFYHCLKGIIRRGENEMPAIAIGLVYFNRFYFPKCFKYDYPIVFCQSRSRWFGRCMVYLKDTAKEKQWQFFDLPVFTI